MPRHGWLPVNHDYRHGDSPVTGTWLGVIYFPCLKMTPLSHWCLGTKLITPQPLMMTIRLVYNMTQGFALCHVVTMVSAYKIIWTVPSICCILSTPHNYILGKVTLCIFIVQMFIVLCHYCGAMLFHSYIAVKTSSSHLLPIMLNNLSHCTPIMSNNYTTCK